MRAGIDPLNPPGMPAGSRIDPETGYLAGVPLNPRPGETELPWALLAGANGLTDPAALSDPIKALDGKAVVLPGFLMPLYRWKAIREFALVGSHFTCCFDRPPGLGDAAIVKLAEDAPSMELTVRPLADPWHVPDPAHAAAGRPREPS